MKYTPSRPKFRLIEREKFRSFRAEREVGIEINSPKMGELNQLTANLIIEHYLGTEWLQRYIYPGSRSRSEYLRIDADAPLETRAPQFVRYWEFAETLLNMQDIPGYEAILDELMHGKIESACGELDVARLIMFHELLFRFISPIRGTKQNYDFEVYYKDGLKVCVEAAAKFEATRPRARSIIQSLKDSRAQLPDDAPGIIIIKVPENWIRNTVLAKEIINVALGYLNQSE